MLKRCFIVEVGNKWNACVHVAIFTGLSKRRYGAQSGTSIHFMVTRMIAFGANNGVREGLANSSAQHATCTHIHTVHQ